MLYHVGSKMRQYYEVKELTFSVILKCLHPTQIKIEGEVAFHFYMQKVKRCNESFHPTLLYTPLKLTVIILICFILN